MRVLGPQWGGFKKRKKTPGAVRDEVWTKLTPDEDTWPPLWETSALGSAKHFA